MEEKITIFIQNNFKKITNCSISKREIQQLFLPIIENIFRNNKNKILISGSQGIGKTTYLELIEKIGLKFFNKRVLSLSLDNFYFDKKDRENLARNIHPLLKTRGVPGTHDIQLLKKIIQQFNKSQYPIKIPLFDKLTDERKKRKKIINKKCKIIILEGWCLNCPPISNKYLFTDINLLEKNFDKKKIWRKYYNYQLKSNYLKLFNYFNYNIYFKASSFWNVLQWRIKQEHHLLKFRLQDRPHVMSKKKITQFIQHYEKITKWMMKKMPAKANLVVYVNKHQNIKRIRKNKKTT